MSLDLARRIKETSLQTGSFVLNSGEITTYYFDKSNFLGDPLLLKDISRRISHILPAGVDVLAGPELWGAILAAGVALESGLPMVAVRKAEKNHGIKRLVEGAVDVNGKRVVVIEDVVTTAGEIISTVKKLVDVGALVKNAVCVIERSGNGRENLQHIGVGLISLFSDTNILES